MKQNDNEADGKQNAAEIVPKNTKRKNKEPNQLEKEQQNKQPRVAPSDQPESITADGTYLSRKYEERVEVFYPT